MLVKYTESKRQIAMGLLSTIDEFHSIDVVQQVLERYTKKNRQIYLERRNGTYIGLVLIVLEADCVVVERMAFIANEETVFNENEIFRSLLSIFPDRRLMGSLKTSAMVERFEMGQVDED
ncbi:riboflavin biosynthesis protein RibT [Pediococcus acidilactici]